MIVELSKTIIFQTITDKSNVVTVTVIGNLYEEKNTAVLGGAASVLPPVLPTLHLISAQKTASVTSKNLELTQVVVLIEITAMVSPPNRDFSELSPRKQPPSLQVTDSRSDLFTDGDYVIM